MSKVKPGKLFNPKEMEAKIREMLTPTPKARKALKKAGIRIRAINRKDRNQNEGNQSNT